MSGLRIVLGVSDIELQAIVEALDLFVDSEADRLDDLGLAHAVRLASDLECGNDDACATSVHPTTQAYYATITLCGTGPRDALFAALCLWLECEEPRLEDERPDADAPTTPREALSHKQAVQTHAHRVARLGAARALASRVIGRAL